MTADALNGDRPARPDHGRTTGAALEAHYPFVLRLVPTVERFPRPQKFLLGDLIQATALDMLERLIEATYSRRRGGHLATANLGLEKDRFLFRPVRDLRVVDPGRDEHAARSIDETGHGVGAWTKAHDAEEERDLFDGIASFQALPEAALRAARGTATVPVATLGSSRSAALPKGRNRRRHGAGGRAMSVQGGSW